MSSASESGFFFSTSCSRSACRWRTSGAPALLAACKPVTSDAPLVDYLRRSTKLHRDHSLLRKPVRLSNAQLRGAVQSSL